MKKRETKKGFTLAETLIALGVLGILAAVTVPVLIQSTNKHTYVHGLKRANLLLKTATSQLMTNNGGTMVKLIPVDGNIDFRDKYCTVLNCIKKCDTNPVTNGCFANTVSLSGISTGFNFNNGTGVILNNGMTMFFTWYISACNTSIYDKSGVWSGCSNGGSLFIDVNGLNRPNKLGRDVFQFVIHANGIAAGGLLGTQYQTTETNWSATCNSAMATGFWSEYLNGLGCAGKILTEGTMNY